MTLTECCDRVCRETSRNAALADWPDDLSVAPEFQPATAQMVERLSRPIGTAMRCRCKACGTVWTRHVVPDVGPLDYAIAKAEGTEESAYPRTLGVAKRYW